MKLPIPTTRTMWLIAAAMAMAVALAAGTARAQVSFTWSGYADNHWFNWENWVPYEFGPPTDNDTATISNGDTVLLDANFTAGDQVNALTLTNGSSFSTNGFEAVIHGGGGTALTLLSGAGTTLNVDPNASDPAWDSFDTDLLTVNSGAIVSMNGGVLEVDSGKLDLNSGAELIGWGSIDLEAGMPSVGSVFDNDGVLQVGEFEGLFPPLRTLDIDVSDPDGRIDLDGGSGNGQVVLGRKGTLDIGAPLSDAFSDLMTFGPWSKLIMGAPWSADAYATLEVNGEGESPATGPTIVTIAGGAFTSTGIINVNSGTLVFESDFNGTTVNVGGQGYDVIVRFDGTTIVTGLNLNGNGAGTSHPWVNGNTTITQSILDWDADGTNWTTVGTAGVLTLNVDQVDLSNNVFNSTINNRGEINVNLTNPLDWWTMAGTLYMNAGTGAVINAGNMIVTGEINVIDGASAAPAGPMGPGLPGTARIAGNNMEFNSTAVLDIAAGTELIIDLSGFIKPDKPRHDQPRILGRRDPRGG